MSDEPDGKATGITRHTRRRVIVSVIVIRLLSGGCQGCARPKVHLELVKKGMTVAEVEAILGKPIERFSRGAELRTYRGDGHNLIDVTYQDGKVDSFHEVIPR
jgi:hypothetical protein